jgi:hypothetical protein
MHREAFFSDSVFNPLAEWHGIKDSPRCLHDTLHDKSVVPPYLTVMGIGRRTKRWS